MIRRIRSWLIAAMLAALGAPLAARRRRTVASISTPFDRPSVRVLQDYTLRAGDTARQVVVIGGDARIEGHGRRRTSSSCSARPISPAPPSSRASFVAVAGTVEIADGAKVDGDFVVIGDADTPPSFSPGGQHVVIGTTGLGDRLRGAGAVADAAGCCSGVRSCRRSAGCGWSPASSSSSTSCLNLLFDAPVRACAVTLRETPFSAFIAGLLVLLLVGPVCVLLAVSVIGIAVIPFVLCAILAAAILGRIGFARWIGMSVVSQDDPGGPRRLGPLVRDRLGADVRRLHDPVRRLRRVDARRRVRARLGDAGVLREVPPREPAAAEEGQDGSAATGGTSVTRCRRETRCRSRWRRCHRRRVEPAAATSRPSPPAER